MAFDEWMTPPEIIELVRRAMGSIDFDPSSNHIAQQYVKATAYCVSPGTDDPKSAIVNGLTTAWRGNVYGNFPYSSGNMSPFVDKAIVEWKSGHADQMILLCNSQTDTHWYHKLLTHCTSFLLWRGRVKFWKIFDGKAWEKWEGQKSRAEGKGKIGNQPRYLNTFFFFSYTDNKFQFQEYTKYGTLCLPL